jgi:hypothetical protein
MQRQFDQAADLRAVIHSARIFPLCAFLSIARQIWATDVTARAISARRRRPKCFRSRSCKAADPNIGSYSRDPQRGRASLSYFPYWAPCRLVHHGALVIMANSIGYLECRAGAAKAPLHCCCVFRRKVSHRHSRPVRHHAARGANPSLPGSGSRSVRSTRSECV